MADEPGQRAGKPLPLSQGKSFATLDEYLAHRAELGKTDRPFFREVGPDRYELVGDRPTEGKRFFTRGELLALFGFEN